MAQPYIASFSNRAQCRCVSIRFSRIRNTAKFKAHGSTKKEVQHQNTAYLFDDRSVVLQENVCQPRRERVLPDFFKCLRELVTEKRPRFWKCGIKLFHHHIVPT